LLYTGIKIHVRLVYYKTNSFISGVEGTRWIAWWSWWPSPQLFGI